jgi:hypothetical protein
MEERDTLLMISRGGREAIETCAFGAREGWMWRTVNAAEVRSLGCARDDCNEGRPIYAKGRVLWLRVPRFRFASLGMTGVAWTLIFVLGLH